MKIVILAGGIGERLWPLSKRKSPKQFQKLLDNQTLIQKSYYRLLGYFDKSDIFIITNLKYLKLIKKQIPEFNNKNFIIEPQRKNTLAAIGLAVYKFYKINPKEIIITMASDHWIDDRVKFCKDIKNIANIANYYPENIYFLGVKPTYPETGYGYIKFKSFKEFNINNKNFILFKVNKFIEKPNLETAKKFINSKNYLWNPSYFIGQVQTFYKLFEKFVPEEHKYLLDFANGNKKSFLKLKSVPIEKAIFEKMRNNFFVMPVNFKWSDIGHWASIKEIRAKNNIDNVVLGPYYCLDTKDCLLYNYTNKILTTIGVTGILIIQTDDGVLICNKNNAQDVKKLVNEMHQNKKFRKFL